MSLEGSQQLAARRVPELDRLIPTSRYDVAPSGENATEVTESECPLRSAAGCRSPRPRADRRAVAAFEGMREPSGENATEIHNGMSLNVRSWSPLAVSQSLTVLSQLPDAMWAPSGENATDSTSSECPSKVRSNRPLATSQSLMVLSQLPDASGRRPARTQRNSRRRNVRRRFAAACRSPRPRA